MSGGVIWHDSGRLKSYSASTKGKVSVVKVEIEVTDAFDLGSLLSGLDRTMEEQKAAKAKKPLAIEDMRGQS